MTKQWLKLDQDRLRQHEPVDVHLSFDSVSDVWCRENAIKLAIEARRNGTYQTLYMTSNDVSTLAVEVLASADQKTLEQLAAGALQRLSRTRASRVLSQVFAAWAKSRGDA